MALASEGRADEELQRLVEHRDGLDVFRKRLAGRGNGAEGRVDRTGTDRCDSRFDLEQHQHVQLDFGVRVMEAAHQARLRAARGDHIDAQWAATGTDGRDRALGDAEQLACVGQERLPVNGEFGAPRRAREQPHTEALLPNRDTPGHGLLGDREFGCGFLELARVSDGDEGTYGFDIHAEPR